MLDQALILVAEDLENDRILIRRAFQQANILNPICFVKDGVEVIEYLQGEGRYANRAEYPLPGLLLLDLKMPKVDGFEVITWIRQHKHLSALRIVVLTSSPDLPDVNKAYELGANSFLVKPVDFKRFTDISRAIKGYWLWMDKAPGLLRPQPESKPQNGKSGSS